jgi:outer membrane receptor protein involved in Fe transport
MAMANPVLAAEAAGAASAASAAGEGTEGVPVEELIVTGPIEFRNRVDGPLPVLSYDLEYFQRFEPLTVGDALKRAPSVTFLSDVLESDGARLRGLAPGYTQILINGERVPGAGLDRSFFVDRIPAELIERVEIVRAPSANRSGDAVAGAINIVMRDALSIDGGYLRAGAIHTNDGRVKGTVGGVWGGQVGPGRLLVGASVQGRRNPKEKLSQRFDAPGGELDNIEVQSDVRDGTDYSLNADYSMDLAGGAFDLSGYFVRTDRTQMETSTEYAEGERTNGKLQTTNLNPLDIRTDNWAINSSFKREMFGGETKLKLGYAVIDDDQFEFEDETTFDDDDLPFPDDDAFESTRTKSRIKDKELLAGLSHEFDLRTVKLEVGLQYADKHRNTVISESEGELEDLPDLPAPRPPVEYEDYEAVAGGLNTIKEQRIDPYVMLSGKTDTLAWEAGLRYETTQSKITDKTADSDLRVSKNDYSILLPSASLRYSLTEADRITASAGRTVKRPNFDFLSPAVLEGEFGDNDFIGNPDLKPETAWGLDLGYERRIGRRGIAGVNVFYRKVRDLQEVVNTGGFAEEALDNYQDALDEGATPEEAAEELTSFLLTAGNVGSGEVWGVELDLSTPLDFVGLENTGVFLNYSFLDSKVSDQFGSRRFNDQAKYVLNVGFIQDLPAYGAAFGATFRKQGKSFGRIIGEEVTTTYGGDLEVFVEKRFGDRFVLRFTGGNLLNARKKEVFNKFNTIDDQIERNFDEYELEAEKAGPVFQLVGRVTF